MQPLWPKIAETNLNTVLATVSWELMEPQVGRFDFSLVDGLIQGARQHNLRLILIWFGSWKNGKSTYQPLWVKTNQQRFPLVQDEKGKSLPTLSTLSDANRDADSRAFAALTKHIREVDGDAHTVLMMQVENEVGVLGPARDDSTARGWRRIAGHAGGAGWHAARHIFPAYFRGPAPRIRYSASFEVAALEAAPPLFRRQPTGGNEDRAGEVPQFERDTLYSRSAGRTPGATEATRAT